MARFTRDESTSQLVHEPVVRVLRETYHTATAQRRCCICERPIIIGDRYARRVFREDGSLEQRDFHLASRGRPACHPLLDQDSAA